MKAIHPVLAVELLVMALIAVLVTTQIIVPILDRKPLFPLFRKRRRALEAEVDSVRAERDEAELEQVIKKEKAEVVSIRNHKGEGQ